MVPVYFESFFSAMAAVGATLFGLVFVVISIRPEVTDAKKPIPVLGQVQVASAYNALLNPLVISLLALVPHTSIGHITLTMALIGLVATVTMGVSLLRDSTNWKKRLTSFSFILGSSVAYGFEVHFALELLDRPRDTSSLYDLTTLLVIIYLVGIAHAWNLVGARQFHIADLFIPLLPKRTEGPSSDKTDVGSPTE